MWPWCPAGPSDRSHRRQDPGLPTGASQRGDGRLSTQIILSGVVEEAMLATGGLECRREQRWHPEPGMAGIWGPARSCLRPVPGRGGQLTGLLAAVHAQRPNPGPLTASLASSRRHSVSGDWSIGQGVIGSELVRIRFEGTVFDPARYAGGA